MIALSTQQNLSCEPLFCAPGVSSASLTAGPRTGLLGGPVRGLWNASALTRRCAKGSRHSLPFRSSHLFYSYLDSSPKDFKVNLFFNPHNNPARAGLVFLC